MIASRRPACVLFLYAIVLAALRMPPACAAATGVSVVVIGAGSRLTIPVMINGTGPYPFVLDTGSDRTVISSELAASLKLPAGPAVSLHDVAGTDTTATVLIDRLAFDHKEIASVHAPVLATAGLGAPGMLGLDGVHNEHVVMDFNAARVTIGPSRQANEAADASAIIVEGKRRFGQLILVDAESHGEPIFVILDSGAEETIGNTALRALVAEESPRTRRLQPTSILSVTGRKTVAEYDSISEIQLGGITIRNVPIDFADLSIFNYLGIGNQPAMLLGMDVLRHFRSVSVDFRRGEALFVTR
jgi:predicted aspartyl protease